MYLKLFLLELGQQVILEKLEIKAQHSNTNPRAYLEIDDVQRTSIMKDIFEHNKQKARATILNQKHNHQADSQTDEYYRQFTASRKKRNL